MKRIESELNEQKIMINYIKKLYSNKHDIELVYFVFVC